MISLPYLIRLNETPRIIRDNFNRDSSACKSRQGYVIHSGVHRSTAFVSLPDAIQSLEFWRDFGGLNPWVEATIEGLELEDCELNAISRIWPDWTFTATKYRGNVYTASRGKGLVTRVSALSWQQLQAKLQILNQRQAF